MLVGDPTRDLALEAWSVAAALAVSMAGRVAAWKYFKIFQV